MSQVDSALEAADSNFKSSIDRWIELLKIPSISTDPAYTADCRKAANWLSATLSGLGFDASVRNTPGHPMVVGHLAASPGAPHVLFYGHYDVQPADPLEKWKTPPFEPVMRKDPDGRHRVYARGAADDKGQLMTFLEASRAWLHSAGKLPVNVTVLLEGEEESGSPSLDPFLKANAGELARDIALVCDTNMWNASTPAITTRLRGLLHEEVTVIGPAIDLHSGLFGGPAFNPVHVLCRILAELHDSKGRVSIPGFYDGVPVLPKATREQWSRLRFSERKFLNAIGLTAAAGETGRSVLEKIWSRPTAEVNGIYGGYTGEGTKTVIASRATAKLSFRLVGSQDPLKIRKSFQKFVKERLPKGCKTEFDSTGGASPAIEISEKNPYLAKAAGALKMEFRKAPVLMGCGGSIPIVRSFRDILKMESLLVGFGLNDDAIHSPNEKYDVECYRRGIRSWIRIIDALAG